VAVLLDQHLVLSQAQSLVVKLDAIWIKTKVMFHILHHVLLHLRGYMSRSSLYIWSVVVQ
jgi:hypothetical protein